MDGWGSLTMLIKRQEAAKFRKAVLRADLKNRKESYLQDAYTIKDEFNFPEVSELEMKKIKETIRRNYRRQRKIQFLFSITLLSAIVYVLFLIL
ncbi:hypothetical protein RQM59_07295 [Flavobacteriaceae bacterium S356]|uniref:Uncharacterized protein n=1 Tax=Asprobacillus argus TaxID=3076534 RepID=A0ABU3LEP0_9FLAO|nr:hypothetical protein [Flavobacteriaceae bacterium S356]